jgi:hypothetical protein
MGARPIDRPAFLGALMAGPASSRCGTASPASTGPSHLLPEALPRAASSGLIQKGVNYDVGITWAPGFNSREVWRPELVRRELRAIRDDLHRNSVLLYGSALDRLVQCAQVA